MIDFQDSRGRLIVVWRSGRNKFNVHIDGKYEAEFKSGKEALEYAQSLVENSSDDQDTQWSGSTSFW